VAAEALEQSMLDSKDKDQLLAIAQALGIKTTARAAKATLIAKILETTGAGPAAEAPAASSASATAAEAPASSEAAAEPAPTAVEVPEVVLGPDGEPLADWEIDLIRSGEVLTPNVERPAADAAPRQRPNSPAVNAGSDPDGDDADGEGDGDGEGDADGNGGEGESRNSRRRRRRRKGKGGEGGQAAQGLDGPRVDAPRFDANRDYSRNDAGRNDRSGERDGGESFQQDPVVVSGYLDLRDEGYGFLRVNGYLASRDDAYVPVKLTRQFGLRKGDYVTGLSRPAGRNEKNPAFLEVHTVNGRDPEAARERPKFEDLTALFPDERLRLENTSDPYNMTSRIIDLVSPIGKGQRGIIVSPPKAGKTTIMKSIAQSIETNHPEVKLIVLLIDKRPEEVTDMRRSVKGEVVASTFDRPSDEHTHVAELVIEKAKRLVEMGEDVVIILDGITRLSRAYNLAAPASGRILSGGIDAGALYPPKRFFGAARNVEEGGSLTILATALVETNSKMDDAIFEEFKGTGNMELRLDRRLAERRIYPAIDVDASSTRHEELLYDRRQLQMVWKLRRVLSGLAADGNAAPGLELLTDRLKTFRTNAEFLNEIAKQPNP
jgi:transcription termination factor Rho